MQACKVSQEFAERRFKIAVQRQKGCQNRDASRCYMQSSHRHVRDSLGAGGRSDTHVISFAGLMLMIEQS